MMANNKDTFGVPSISTPSLYAPKLSAPTITVPQIFVPGGTNKLYRPNQRQHVKDLGDILLGNPITGTKQLRHTLEDYNLKSLVNVPLVNRLAGLYLAAKERAIVPLMKGNAKEAGVNLLESFGYSMDMFANPIKSLMPWAGGGKSGDFARSMGWIDDEYRKQFQWDTGNGFVDLIGEVISDPTFVVDGATKALAKRVENELTEQVMKSVGHAAHNDNVSNILKTAIQRILKDVEFTFENDEKIVRDILEAAEYKQKILEADIKLGRYNSIRESDIETFNKIKKDLKGLKNLKNVDNYNDIVKAIYDIKQSQRYTQYKAIRTLSSAANKIDDALITAAFGINPLTLPAALIKTHIISNPFKALLNRMRLDLPKIRLENALNDKATRLRYINNSINTNVINAYRSTFDYFDTVLKKYNLDIDKLIRKYVNVMNSLPAEQKAIADVTKKRFKEWLLKQIPELRRMYDVVLEKHLTDIAEVGIKKARPLFESPIQMFPDITEFTKEFDSLVDAVDDGAALKIVANESEKSAFKETLSKAVSSFWQVPDKSLEDFNILELTKFFQDRFIRADHPNWNLTNLKDYLEYIGTTQTPEAIQEINKFIRYLGLTEDNVYKAYFYLTSNSEKDLAELLKNRALDVYVPETKNVVNIVKQKAPATLKQFVNLKSPEEVHDAVYDLFSKTNMGLDKENVDYITKGVTKLNQTCEETRNLVTEIKDKVADISYNPNLNKRVISISEEDLFTASQLEYIKTYIDDYDEEENIFELLKALYSIKDFDYEEIKTASDLLDKLSKKAYTLKARIRELKINDPMKVVNAGPIELLCDDIIEVLNTKTVEDITTKIASAYNVTDTLYRLVLSHYGMFKLQIMYTFDGVVDTALGEYLKDLSDKNSTIRKNLMLSINQIKNAPNVLLAQKYVDQIYKLLNDIDATNAFRKLLNDATVVSSYDLPNDIIQMINSSLFDAIEGISLKDSTSQKVFISRLREEEFNSIITNVLGDLSHYKKDALYKYYVDNIKPVKALDIANEKYYEKYNKLKNIIYDDSKGTELNALEKRLTELTTALDNKTYETYKNYSTLTEEISKVKNEISNLVKLDYDEYLELKAYYDITHDQAGELRSHYDITKEKETMLKRYKSLNDKIHIAELTDEEYAEYEELKNLISLDELDTNVTNVSYRQWITGVYNEIEFNLKNYLRNYFDTLKEIWDETGHDLYVGNRFTDKTLKTLNNIIAEPEELLQALKEAETIDVDLTSVYDLLMRTTGYDFSDEIVLNFMQLTKSIDDIDITSLNRNAKVTNQVLDDDTIARLTSSVDQSLSRAISGTFKEIGDTNAQNIMNYISKTKVDDLVKSTLGYANIVDWSRTNGMWAVKKFEPKVARHVLNNLDYVDNNAFVGFIQNFDKAYQYTLKPHTDEFLDRITNCLIDTYTHRDFDVAISPTDAASYFTYLRQNDSRALVTWHLITGDARINEQLANAYTKSQNDYIKSIPVELTKKLRDAKDPYYIYQGLTDSLINQGVTGEDLYSEFIEKMNGYDIEFLHDVVQKDLSDYWKSPDSLNAHKGMFKQYVDKDLAAYNNCEPIASIENDKRTMKEVLVSNKKDKALLNKIEKKQEAINNAKSYLEKKDLIKEIKELREQLDNTDLGKAINYLRQQHGIKLTDTVNSDKVQKALYKERQIGLYENLNRFNARQLHTWIDRNTDGRFLFVIDKNQEANFKHPSLNFTEKELKEAQLVIIKVKELDGAELYLIHGTGGSYQKQNYDYILKHSPLDVLQETVTNSFKANRHMFYWEGMDLPDALFTGQMLDRSVYNVILEDEDILKALGNIDEQKVYSKIDENNINTFYTKNILRPNLAIAGAPNAYNIVLDMTKEAFEKHNFTPYKATNRLHKSALNGSLEAIKRVNNEHKYLQLILNDDFYLGNPMFKRIFKDASDKDIREIFKRNNFEAVIVRQDKQGNPKVYKIYIENRRQLNDAIKGGAVILPHEVYRNAILSINKHSVDGAIMRLYKNVIVSTFKTIYLTTPGFLLRNGLDSLLYKNLNETGGVFTLMDNIKYEMRAMKLLEEYDKVMARVLEKSKEMYGIQSLTKDTLREVLKELSAEEQNLFRLTDLFMHSAGATGLSEVVEDYLLSFNLKDVVLDESTFEQWWAKYVLNNPVSMFTNNVNDVIEKSARFGLFLNLVDNGLDPSNALRRVVDTHFDYKLREFEKLEQIFWFSTFPINNAYYYLNEGLTRNPAMLKMQMDALELSWNDGQYYTWDKVKRSNYLSYQALTGNLRLQLFGKNVVLKTGSSVLDFFNLMFNPAGEATERLNPLLSVLLGYDDIKQLNPVYALYNRGKQIVTGKSFLPSVYAVLNEYKPKHQLKKATVNYYRTYNKSRWTTYPRRRYYIKPSNQGRMLYRFANSKYFFSRGKGLNRWKYSNSNTVLMPYYKGYRHSFGKIAKSYALHDFHLRNRKDIGYPNARSRFTKTSNIRYNR